MFSIKRVTEALDLSNHRQHLMSANQSEHEETFSTDDEIPKKVTYDSGFVDTTDENNTSIMVKQEPNDEHNDHHHYHSTPLRPQQIQSHFRHRSSSSSACSSPTRLEKESRNTRFLGGRAVSVLNHWFQLNRDYPYPDEERTEQLANEAGITQKQVKKWFANKRVRSQTCYKPLHRNRKANVDSTTPRVPPTNYNYIINNNNIAPSLPTFAPANPVLFNPMATSMMMLMMQQQWMSTMMAAAPSAQTSTPPPPPVSIPANSSKSTVDGITRFWL